MKRRLQLQIQSLLFYIGHLQYTYIHSPIKKRYLNWKYRKEQRQVKERYLKGK